MMAYLALSGGEAVHRERLAALLWSDRPDDQARTNLRKTLSELRDNPLIRVERETVAVSGGTLVTDIEMLEALARARDPEAMRSALARWNGPILSDLDNISPLYDEWLARFRASEQERLIETVTHAGTEALDAGRANVRGLVTALQVIDPLNERVLRLGLTADARAGDSAGLHRRYAVFRDVLRHELNASPSAETQELFRKLVPTGGDIVPAPIQSQELRRTRQAPAPRKHVPSRDVAAPAASRRSTFMVWGLAGGLAFVVVAAAVLFLAPFPGQPSTAATHTAAKPQAVDPVAYELYRRGVDASRQRISATVSQAVALLQQAVSRAPKFSRAWSALAFAQFRAVNRAVWLGRPAGEIAQLRAAAVDSAHRAIALDPRNGEPYGVLASIGQNDVSGQTTLALLNKGIAIEPNNVFLIRSRGQVLLGKGLAEESLQDFRRAHQLDPLDPRTFANLSSALIASGHIAEARQVLDQGFALYPAYVHIWRGELVARISDGNFDSAEAMLAPDATRPDVMWETLTPTLRLVLRALRTGRLADVEAAMIPLREGAKANNGMKDWAPWGMALLGRNGDAYAVYEGDAKLSYVDYEMYVDSVFASFRRDPRYVTLFRNSIPYWQKTGRWPNFCADPTLPYSCKAEAHRLAPEPQR